MEDFIGINLRRQDPIQYVNCAGFVREYHDWVIDEGDVFQNDDANFSQHASLEYPNNTYNFVNGYQLQTYENFPIFYTNILAGLDASGTAGSLPICANLKGNLPRISGGVGDFYAESVPVYNDNSIPGDPTSPDSPQPFFYCLDEPANSPYSYEHFTDWVYQYAAVFGNGGSEPIGVKPLDDSGYSVTYGQNKVGYIEIWNEQDKIWFAGDNDCEASCVANCIDGDLADFHPTEYAAMTNAAFDGFCGQMKGDLEELDDDDYAFGVKNADAGLKYVFGGLQEFRDAELTYVESVFNIFSDSGNPSSRTASTCGKTIPFDVINFHHYNDAQWEGTGGTGVSPEDDIYTDASGVSISFKEQLIAVRQRVDGWETTYGESFELWMSEFGYDTNLNSDIAVPTMAATSTEPFVDQQEVQARWLTRAFLEIASAGWDRAIQFCIRDEISNPENGYRFNSSGLVGDLSTNHAPKKSYYATTTMKAVLKGTKFNRYVLENICSNTVEEPRVYEFTKGEAADPNSPGEVVYVAWLPTSINASASVNIPLPEEGATLATIIRKTFGDLDGVRETLDISGGDEVTVTLTEDPIYIVFGISESSPPIVSCPDELSLSPLSCDAVLLNIQNTAENPFPSSILEIYYYDKADSEEGSEIPVFDASNPDWKIYTNSLATGTSCNNVVISGLPKSTDNYFIHVKVKRENVETGDQFIYSQCTLNTSTLSCENTFDISTLISSSTITDISGDTPAPASSELSSHILSLFNNRGFDLCNTENDVVDFVSYQPAGTSEYAVEIVFPTGIEIEVSALALFDEFGSGPFSIEYSPSITGTNYRPLVPDFVTYEVNKWQYMPANTCAENGAQNKIRRLRLIKPDTEGRLGKIVLYGHIADGTFAEVDCCDIPENTVIGSGVGTESLQELVGDNTLPSNPIGTPLNLTIRGDLVIDMDYTFDEGSEILMTSGASIRVQSGITFNVNGTVLQSCEDLWKGIIIDYGGKIIMDNSTLRDAIYGIDVMRSETFVPDGTGEDELTLLQITNSIFEKNWVGIRLNQVYRSGVYPIAINDISVASFVKGTIFDGLEEDLKPFPEGITVSIETAYDDGQSYTGILCNSALSFNVNASPERNSLFRSLKFGIKSSVSTLHVSGTEFQNMDFYEHPEKPYIKTNGGVGIFSHLSDLTLVGQGSTDSSPFNFTEVNAPVIAFFGLVNLSQSRVAASCNNGFYCYGAHSGSVVSQNRIETSGTGISFSPDWKAGFFINENDIVNISPETDRPADGIYVFGWSFSLPDVVEQEISDNNIRVKGATRSTGLRLHSLTNCLVQGNVIESDFYGASNTGAGDNVDLETTERTFGIYAAGISGCQILENSVSGSNLGDLEDYDECDQEGSPFLGYNSDFTAIQLIHSDMNQVHCNSMDLSEIGMGILGNCASLNEYRENQFKELGTGLWMMAEAQTDNQENTGNRWMKDDIFPEYNGRAARIMSNGSTDSPTHWSQNQFFVNSLTDYTVNPGITSDPSICPPEAASIFTPEENWFLYDEDGSLPNTCTSGIICERPKECYETTRTQILEEGTGRYWKYAKGVYNFDLLHPIYAQLNRRDVYQAIKEQSDFGIEMTDVAVAFIEAQANNSVGQFYNVEKMTNDMFSWTMEEDLLLEDIRATDSVRQSATVILTDEFRDLTASEIEEKLTLIYGDGELVRNRQLKDSLRIKKYEEISTLTNEILLKNSEISAMGEVEKAEIRVNEMYLRNFGLGEDLKKEELEELTKIAGLCPTIGGRAVYKARTLYAAFFPNAQMQWDNCKGVRLERGRERSDADIKDTQSEFNLYPNPATSDLLFDYSEESRNWQIVTLTGIAVRSGLTTVGKNKINVSNYPAGVYILKIFGEKGISSEKFVVQK